MTTSLNYEVLINEDRIRATLKRMFSNSVGEVLGELLQNAQRARATKVQVETFDYGIGGGKRGFVFHDNGHGLVDGIHSLHTLLKLADSHFEDPAVGDQHPMGLGFHSLLAWDQVTAVRLESNYIALDIDAAAWWEDPRHYKSWHTRVRQLDEKVEGLKLTVYTTDDVSGTLENALPTEERYVNATTVTRHPAIGYDGLLDVMLNSHPVITEPSVKDGYQPIPLFETIFKGNRLVIGLPDHATYLDESSIVNWYGQLVDAGAAVRGFKFYYEVREGRPVNPKTPSRAGLIEDAAFDDLRAFVVDELFAWAADPANVELVTPKIVNKLFGLDFERAMTACPFFVARRVRPLDPDGYRSYQDFDRGGADKDESNLVLLRFDDESKTLLRSTIQIHWPEAVSGARRHGHTFGLASFLTALGIEGYVCENYELQRRLDKRILELTWWPEFEPGTTATNTVMFASGPGRYALAPASSLSFTETQAFPEGTTNLFAFDDNTFATLQGVYLVAFAKDRVDFLERYGMTPCLSREDDTDRQTYLGELDTIIRGMLGDSVRVAFTTPDLLALFADDEDGDGPAKAIASVKYHYPKKGDATETPTHITVTAADGRTKKVRLYGA